MAEMQTPLFAYAPKLEFEKTAQIDLGEDQAQWFRKILSELYRTLPEASQYAPQVRMLQTDDEQGFALGVVTLDGGTDSAIAEQAQQNKTTNAVHIPVIVKHHVMSPLDLMLVRGKVLPLNAARLREALFRPMGMELLTEDWGDTSILSMFNLPGRSDVYPGSGTGGNIGGDGMTTMFGSGMKMSYELLEEIAPTLLAADTQKIASRLEADPALMDALRANPVYGHAIAAIAAGGLPPEHDAMLKAAAEVAGADVAQLSYDDDIGKYLVKSASRIAFHPLTVEMDRYEFLKFAGEELARKVDSEGPVTVTESKTTAPAKTEAAWSAIRTPGIYDVKTPDGNVLTGWVFPDLIDFDGKTTAMAAFTDGKQAAVQSKIMGARAASGPDLPSAKPRGGGLFYAKGADGIQATVPVVVQSSSVGADDAKKYVVNSLTAGERNVHLVPGMSGMQMKGGDLFIGKDVRFLPLEDAALIALLESPKDNAKTASYLFEPEAQIFAYGDRCRVTFEGTPKLAARYNGEMSTSDAVFALCLGGLSARDAEAKVASAQYNQVAVRGLQDIVPLSDHVTRATTKVAALSHKILALRQDFLKEAAVLPDVQTVDTVLGLGLMNSENIRAYVAKLPYLEKTLGMLGHLLLASRLGLSEVPEHAAARCIRGLDEVCRGLSALGLRDLSEGEM